MIETAGLHQKVKGRLELFGVSISYLLVLGLVWLVGCVPAEPIQVTRVVGVTMTATVGGTETAVPTNTPTITVIPSPVVEATATPTVEVTAVPTEASPSETPSPTPSVTPHLPMVEGQLPVIGHDLLFLADGSLKRWSHERGAVEVLLTGVGGFRLSGDGATVIATEYTDGEPSIARLIVYDLTLGTQRTLVDNIVDLRDYEVAPDGRQIAYLIGDATGDTHENGLPRAGTIFLKTIDGSESPESFAYCTNINDLGGPEQTGCGSLTWTPNSQQILWSDVQGLWAQHLDGSEAQLLRANVFDFDSFWGRYQPHDWSSSGRYLRLFINGWERFHEAVYDFQTGTVLDIPYTGWSAGGPVTTHVMWLEGERLFSVRGGWGEGEITAEVLRIESETESFVDGFVVELAQVIPAERLNYVSDPVRLENGSIAFSLNVLDSQPNLQAGLYILDELGVVPRKVNDWPYDNWYGASTIWSPDGGGAFVLWYAEGGHEFVYVPADEAVFYNVRPLLGELVLPFSFTWVP